MERSKRNSKSRQSNKSRVAANSNENTHQSTPNTFDHSGFQQPQQNPQLSGGPMRSKPCREIYRPPSCRRGRSNQPNSGGVYQNYYSYTATSENPYNNDIIGSGGQCQANSILSNSDLSNANNGKEKHQCQESALGNGPTYRPLNINAKEFHFKPASIEPLTSPENKSPYYGIVSAASSNGSGTMFYSLCQSKSSGDITHYSDTSNEQIRENRFSDIPTTGQYQSYSQTAGPGLQQSKSSGNIPGRSKVVRFLDEGIQNEGDRQGIFEQLLKSTNSLRIAGEHVSSSGPGLESPLAVPQAGMAFLQKSRTTLHMGIGGIGLQMNQFQNPSYRNFQRQSVPSPGQALMYSPSPIVTQVAPLKRSKSFNSKPQVQNKNFGHSGSDSRAETRAAGVACSTSPNFGDFCINKWPKSLQQTITAAVTGGDRLPPRNRINMVTSIFDILLETNNSTDLGLNESDSLADDSTEQTDKAKNGVRNLINPAVHIFLYFIQREKDHTVRESLLNTCFAIFQSLSVAHGLSPGSGSIPFANTKNQWSTFLSFLCSLYCQVKVIRIQYQKMGNSADQVSMTVLTLLCDSCLATLRSLPVCYSPETMDSLFTVMTSIGRDIEKTFPAKMKQILTTVRDALLGLGPFGTLTEAPPVVQKTLMQLIELHAANWHLPASAVRYYYSNPTSAPNNVLNAEQQEHQNR